MVAEQCGRPMSINVIFTGIYRNKPAVTDMRFEDRIEKFTKSGIKNVYWYTWKNHNPDSTRGVEEMMRASGVEVRKITEPFPHDSNGIRGRQRQIYNIKEALKDFSQDDIVLKLRWDLDFNDKLLENIQEKRFFDKRYAKRIKRRSYWCNLTN